MAVSSPKPLKCVFQLLVSVLTLESSHKALPSPVASLGINKDRSLRVRRALTVRQEWRLLNSRAGASPQPVFGVLPGCLSTSEHCRGLRWFLTSPAVHPSTLQSQLMERCVPAPQPSHSEATVSVAGSVLGHAATSHEWGTRGWAAGCSPAHSNCTSLCWSSSIAPCLETSLKYKWIWFFLKTHTKSFQRLYRAIKTRHMEEYQWWLGWCKMIEV